MPAFYMRAAFRSTDVSTGALIINVLHYEVDALSSPVDPVGVAADVYAHLGPKYLPMMYNNEVLHDVTVTTETYPGSVPAQGVKSVEVAGTRSTADQKLPPALCALLSWKTSTPKRYARGHMFCPPATSSASMTTAGLIDSSGVYGTACSAFGTAYITGFTAGSTSYAPIIFSKSQVHKALTPFIFPIIGFQLKSNASWLRKRSSSP